MSLQIVLRILTPIVVLAWLLGCGKTTSVAQKDKQAPPAKVENGGIKETELATIRLAAKAGERLGIQTVPVEYGPAMRSETMTGEVAVPAGQSLTAMAPVAGTVEPAEKTEIAAAAQVRKGQPLFHLLPLVPAQRDLKTTAEAELASARTRAEASRVRVGRAEQMLKDRIGSVRTLEDARQELDLAETAVKAAEAKLEQLKRAPLDSDVVMLIVSPLTGILTKVHVTSAQQVAAGAALFEVVRLDPVWIRVPVYAGKHDAFVPGASAQISLLGSNGKAARLAKPIAAPPSADALSATVDLYFELANPDLALRPQQKVSVTLPLRGEQRALKVPKSSILYFGRNLVIRGSEERLAPILMTTLATALALLPIVVGGNKPGQEIEHPMAAVIMGGLMTSTVLNLFLMSALYYRFAKR